MIHAAHILFALYLFIFCVNLGFYFIGNSFGISSISQRSIDFNELNNTLKTRGENFETNAFDPTFIFGDFGKGAGEFWDLLSGGYVLETFGNMGFSEFFIFPLQVIFFGFLLLGGLVYYISGRQ